MYLVSVALTANMSLCVQLRITPYLGNWCFCRHSSAAGADPGDTLRELSQQSLELGFSGQLAFLFVLVFVIAMGPLSFEGGWDLKTLKVVLTSKVHLLSHAEKYTFA